MRYSNLGNSKRNSSTKSEPEKFKIWIDNFKIIVRILEILHLLRYPTMCLYFSADFLLSKFGTFKKIPQFGAGLCDEKNYVTSDVTEEEVNYIDFLANKDNEVQRIKNWINNLPNLSDDEIRKIILEEQKVYIKDNGFKNWKKFTHVHDHRIDEAMISKLKQWSKEKELFLRK